MANFSALKTAIQNAIRQNGNEEITGDVLQQILLSVVNTMGDGAINTIEQNLSSETLARQGADNTLQSNINAEALARGNADTQLQNAINAIKANIDNGYVYAGIATTSSTPVSGKVFYIATAAGTYTNFGGQVLTQGINILRFDGSAWSNQQLIGIDDVPTAGSNSLVKSGGVQNELALGAVYDVSAKNPTAGPNNDGKWESLSALLSDANLNTLIPIAYRKGGMSIKFVHTNDNKYVQYRLMTDTWSININDWSFCGDVVLVENPEWIYVLLDAEKRILAGLKPDGSVEWSIGVPTPVKTYIDNAIAEIKNGTEETDLDGLNKIISFLSDFSTSDTLKNLLDTKVDKEEGKSLIDSEFAASQSVVENPEYMVVETDKDGRILGGRKIDGTKFENMPYETPASVIESVDSSEWIKVDIEKNGKILGGYKTNGKFSAPGGIEGIDFSKLQNQINTLDERVDSLEDIVNVETDEIPYNDLLSIGSRTLKVYNPYKESKQHQYTGQMHFHSWTKFDNREYPEDFPGEKWKVPYGYSIAAIPAGETNTEKYLWDMPHEKRVAILNALAMAYIWRHKKLGYDFVALSDYAQFQDVTHQPNLRDITYLQTQYPDAYAYFASLYLDGFDVNDFDADGNLKNFEWLCDSYESVTTTDGIQQHIVVHCAPNYSVPYFSGTFDVIMNKVQNYGCIAQWPHPTDTDTFATHGVMDTVPKRLRLMEIYDGISIRKYDQNGNMTNRTYIPAGVMLDEPIDYMLTKGHFIFGMAISDERPTYGRSGANMYILNPAKNIKNGCIKVFGDELTDEELFASILSGNFYASSDSDASINSVSIENGKYIVDVGIEGVVVEFLKENNTIVKTVTTSAGNTTASYDIDGSEKFVRARIYKLNNLQPSDDYWYWNKEWMIWTQPLFISKTIL